MSHCSGNGLFVLSVDVLGTENKGTATQVTQLLQSLHRHQIPATWSIASPGTSELTALIRGASLRHEIALLGDSSWVGQGIGRTQFARELAQRVDLAAAQGLSMRTLALLDAELTTNLDLLVKHRISVVRTAGVSGFQPQSLRFGVWQAPVSFLLPAKNRWQLGSSEWSIGRALSRAGRAGTNELVHAVIDLRSLADPTALGILERTFAVVKRLQSKGLVLPVTLKGLVQYLVPQRQLTASRSVLHAA